MNPAFAIKEIHPDALPDRDYKVRDDSDGRGPYIAAWHLDAPQPTQADIQAAWEASAPARALEAVRAARAAEYPALGDQLDAVMKGGQALTDMQALCMAVKAKHPKP